MSKTIAIVGRPNVGKSTLFNRLIGQRKSIVDDISGVTRDRIYGEVDWRGTIFDIVDTGGYVESTSDMFELAIKEQVKIAIEESNLILFLVDVTCGITNLDDEIASLLRKSKKTVILVVNKVDNFNRQIESSEFYSLGFEKMITISSISGTGSGDLLDMVYDHYANEIKNEVLNEDELEEFIPKVSIIGQPNVGKSSMVNALLGEQRNIVTDIAGTTRDSINSIYNKFGKKFILVDTAGIRRKTKVNENLEFYSVIRAIKSVEDSDIVIIMIDAATGIEAQDLALFKMVQRRKKALILIVNKWDTYQKETNTLVNYENRLKEKLLPNNDIPILFTSATEKQRIFKVIEKINEVAKKLNKRIATKELNDKLLKIIENFPPPAYRGNAISIKYITQLHAKTPTFAFFSNKPKYIPENYKNFLKNKLREIFDFEGIAINLIFKEK